MMTKYIKTGTTEFLLAYVDDMDEWWMPVRNINQISEVNEDEI